ncbi:RanGTP-binding protein-domain-containing protein [Exophiala viscosa]|uniref:RanGTP-binding protein-domain-containing protein n=1 Tax=Exophiala viscosa TaxID=2486360 RepID=A0AAN6DUK4_9EURO|nr:RanGTP-binding protein-domain-containing protein [Exophiala viscosa]KAI1623518.1 RanGTP-binding protein-domain-containing protein [Exophiala viscosa]
MDYFVGKITQQAMNYAIRSGVTLTASYAIRQSTRYLNNVPKSDVRDELSEVQQRLQRKIHIVSPAIDMIELIAARGNTTLESAVVLTKELRLEIESLGQRLTRANASEEAAKKKGSTQLKAQNELELKRVIADMKQLLDRIEDAVPLINLAITTSGASLSTSLPHTVSPSRLLQASTFLTAGDTQYSISPQSAVQIGPTFTLSVYMLFAGHDRPQNEEEVRETTWKEVIHKAKVKLRRVPLEVVVGSRPGSGSGADAVPSMEISVSSAMSELDKSQVIRADIRADEFAYQLMIVEDFDDDRVHDFEEDQPHPGPFDDVQMAGIRETMPIHEISKIFYADTSKVLNIGADAESNHPVLLLKRDINAVPPRRMLERDQDDEGMQREEESVNHDHHAPKEDPWRFPPSLDPEWIAFEVYTESEASDTESEVGNADTDTSTADIETSKLSQSMSSMHINSPGPADRLQPLTNQTPPWANAIKTSLSLLELLLRLTSLQQFQQQSHLSIPDELLNFFLEESATTGAGGDENYRQALRAEARRRVGWDPYDESPMKRRGEEYQYHSPGPSPRADGDEGTWSPREGQARPDFPGSPSPRNSPSPFPAERNRGSRASWLKREEGRRKSSPLRPRSAVTDEGIGTSPASGVDRADT